MEQEPSLARMLPIVEYDGRSWYVDQRMREFRGVRAAHDRVNFDSHFGDGMLSAWIEQLCRYDPTTR